MSNQTKREDMRFCQGEDGCAYYVKQHVPFDSFMDALRREVNSDDPILLEKPKHCWMRVCRDFQEETQVIVEAVPHSKGAFATTWIQEGQRTFERRRSRTLEMIVGNSKKKKEN